LGPTGAGDLSTRKPFPTAEYLWEWCILLCDSGSYWLDLQQDLWLYSTLTSTDGTTSSSRGTKAVLQYKPVVWALCHLSATIFIVLILHILVVILLNHKSLHIVWLEVCSESVLSTKPLSN
jgi:hypothetical protein